MSSSKHFQALSSVPSPHTFHLFKVADYKKIFDKFDVDSGGSIDAQELGTLIRGLGWVTLVLIILLSKHAEFYLTLVCLIPFPNLFNAD